jgi:hypothetical protein
MAMKGEDHGAQEPEGNMPELRIEDSHAAKGAWPHLALDELWPTSSDRDSMPDVWGGINWASEVGKCCRAGRVTILALNRYFPWKRCWHSHPLVGPELRECACGR